MKKIKKKVKGKKYARPFYEFYYFCPIHIQDLKLKDLMGSGWKLGDGNTELKIIER